MAATKRPQNRCKSCGYTWHPRGKSLSNKCPNCGGTQISTVGSWGGLAALLFIGYAIFGSNDKPADTTADVATSYAASQPTETTASPAAESPPTTQHSGDSEQGEQSNSSELEEATPTVETEATPSSICEHEGNIFSRNNCEWRECEKPDFSELEECANKKPKANAYGR